MTNLVFKHVPITYTMSPCLPKCSNDDPRMHVTRHYKAEQSQEIKMPNLGVGTREISRTYNFWNLQILNCKEGSVLWV